MSDLRMEALVARLGYTEEAGHLSEADARSLAAKILDAIDDADRADYEALCILTGHSGG